MYPANLITNEVKNSAGTEEEFLRLSSVGRQLVFSKSGELPANPHRVSVSHLETGTGTAKRRRSVVRVDKTVAGQVDVTKTERISAYVVVDLPIGDLTSYAEAKNVLANLISNVASQGASNVILYDCTGYGADALINGGL